MAKQGFNILNTLNSQSVPEGEHHATEFVVEMIQLNKIEPNPENFYDTEDIEALAADIKQNGLMHNIVVSPSEDFDGYYTIISGERRYRAYRLLKQQGNDGYDAIPAMVDTETNPLLLKLKLISANASARVLSDYELSEQAAQIESIIKQLKREGVELPGRAREIAAQALGVSTAQAGRLTKIANDLVPEVKEKFAAGQIGVTEAYEVATLPPEQQAQAVEARAEKVSEPKPPSITQADIDRVLLNAGRREQIQNIYAKQPNGKDAADGLKRLFGQGGQTFTFASGCSGFVDYATNGITFTVWDEDRTKDRFSWASIHKLVLELIASGKIVLPEADEESVPAFMGKKLNTPEVAEQPAPKPREQEQATAPAAPPITRLVPWAQGFDDELLSAAACIEDWNEMSCHPAEYKLIKSLVIQEAAMRKRRAE